MFDFFVARRPLSVKVSVKVSVKRFTPLFCAAAFFVSIPNAALSQSATPAWTYCANEGGFCRFEGTRQVRYGANGQHVVRTIAAQNGGSPCTNAVFGNPVVGVAKRCEVDASATPVLTPVINSFNAAPKTIAAGETTTLSWSVGNATRLYINNGVGIVSGTQVNVRPAATTTYRLTARNASGTSQRTVTVAVSTNPPPPPAQAPTISGFSAAPGSIVSGGSATLNWSVANATSVSIVPGIGTVSGSSVVVRPTQTTQYTLNATNAQGTSTRALTIAVNAPTPPPDHSGMGPYIDRTKIPSGAPGVSVDRLSPTSEQPVSSNIGAFRTMCDFSHMNFDDPLVYPGRPGAAHLHAFFGNTGVNANSTDTSIRTTGNSTCRGGTINRSAYWVPAIIDTRDGTPVKPSNSHFYYKTGYNGILPRDVQPFPLGLRMIAGSANASGPQSRAARWKCINGGEHLVGASIQNCPVGAELWQEIFFPQCWDGKNLDSPDHKSHMAYPSGGACPSSHQVALPEITYNIVYKVTEANAPLRWRLSSDMYSKDLPGGYSSHGDWINGWKQDLMKIWVEQCNQRSRDCRSHLLGDGRAMGF